MGPGTAIVLTDRAIVKDLMETRSHATVDRPPMYAADLVSGGAHVNLARYSMYAPYAVVGYFLR
jgi:hypothetical protein